MTHTAEIRPDNRLYVDGRRVDFIACRSRPPSCPSPNVWINYGDVGLVVDVYRTQELVARGREPVFDPRGWVSEARVRFIATGWCP